MAVFLVLFIGLLTAVAFGYVLSPLIPGLRGVDAESMPDFDRVRTEPFSDLFEDDLAVQARRQELFARRDAIYANIRDAEFDRELGKLSDEDFAAIRQQSMMEAAVVLQQIDESVPDYDADLDAQIEKAVADLRAGSSEGAGRSSGAGTGEPSENPTGSGDRDSAPAEGRE